MIINKSRGIFHRSIVPNQDYAGQQRHAIPFVFVTTIIIFTYAIVCLLVNGHAPTQDDLLGLFILGVYSIYLLNVLRGEWTRREFVSPLALFCCGSLIYFGLTGMLYYDSGFFQNAENREFYIFAILYLLVYTVGFHLAYLFLTRAQRKSRATLPNLRAWHGLNVAIAVPALSLLGWFGRLHLINIGVYLHAGFDLANANRQVIGGVGLWRLFETLPDVAGWIALSYYMGVVTSGKSIPRGVFYCVVALILTNVLYWLPTATKFQIVQAIIVPACIIYLFNRRLPKIRYIFALVFFLAAMFPITYIIRAAESVVLGKGMSAGGVSQLVSTIQLSTRYVGTLDTSAGANGRLFGRLDELEPISGAVRVINGHIEPMHLGQEYENFFVNLVPRALWPDKPNVSYGNYFGHLIGVLRATALGTSIAPTLVGESYLNFGLLGVGVAVALAAIYFLMYRSTWTMRSRQTAYLLYATTVPTMLYMDASFALYFSGLLQLWLIILVLGRLMSYPAVYDSEGGKRMAGSGSRRAGVRAV